MSACRVASLLMGVITDRLRYKPVAVFGFVLSAVCILLFRYNLCRGAAGRRNSAQSNRQSSEGIKHPEEHDPSGSSVRCPCRRRIHPGEILIQAFGILLSTSGADTTPLSLDTLAPPARLGGSTALGSF